LVISSTLSGLDTEDRPARPRYGDPRFIPAKFFRR